MTRGYDHKERSVRHLDIWGMRTVVHCPQRRFECPTCDKPFTERLAWIEPKRRQTQAFEAHIYPQGKGKTSGRQVALQAGLSESTVLEIFKRLAKQAVGRQEGGRVRKLGGMKSRCKRDTSRMPWCSRTWNGDG